MSADVFSSFGALDELIQVVYQSIYRFVAISTVSDDSWTVHLGLAGSDGRWWRGTWHEGDVHKTLGSNASESILEQFSENLSELFVGGELFIGNVNPTPQSKLKFTVGPAAKRPVCIDLDELSASEAAEFATTILLDIALQAQSRKGRLHVSSIPYPSFTFTPAAAATSSSSKAREPHSPKEISPHKPPRIEVETSSSKPSQTAPPAKASGSPPEPSRAQPKQTSAAPPQKRPAPPSTQKTPTPRPKGFPLLNPNKKARKYQAVEFDDDDD